jgi:formate-dependent nitrite reductase membrane component NrfD
MNTRNENAPKTLAGTATLIRPERGGTMAGRGEEWVGKASTYYGVPLIKKAHWGWQIILYFFLGGTGGGAYLVATLADLLGLKDTRLIRTGRYLAFVCVLISPILLIWDLGRPERFHHMLRVIKLRSPMSLGTWALSMFGLCAGITTAYQMAEDGLLNWLPFFPRLFSAPIRPAWAYSAQQRRSFAASASHSAERISNAARPHRSLFRLPTPLERGYCFAVRQSGRKRLLLRSQAGRKETALPVKLIEAIGSFFGLFVASYTGVLLSTTAVPVWARAKHILGPLFLTSGLSTALASLSLILSLRDHNQDTLERLERAELVTMTTELGLISTLPSVLGPLAKPLFKSRTGILFSAGTIGGGVLLPLLVRSGLKLTRRSTPRTLNIALSLMVLVGGLILRYTWIVVGRASADDPGAIHEYNAMEWSEKKH